MLKYVFYTHIPKVIHNLVLYPQLYNINVFVRIGRIELPSHPWQGRILPLNHIRRASFIVHLPGLEPRTTVPKTGVISISP